MELKDTMAEMTSGDYKERFKAEYNQAVIRYRKLKEMLDKWDRGKGSNGRDTAVTAKLHQCNKYNKC